MPQMAWLFLSSGQPETWETRRRIAGTPARSFFELKARTFESATIRMF